MNQRNDELIQIRNEIDAIDQQLLELLNHRATCALKVATIKIKHEGAEVEFYRPEREAQVLKKIADQNKGPLSAKSLMVIFLLIITKYHHF